MFIKRSSSLLATYGNFSSISPKPTSSTSSTSKRRDTRQRRYPTKRTHNYATIAGDDSEQHEPFENAQYPWPKAAKGRSSPTPYQIFHMKDGAAYSKARYYELVKLYHPDRTSNQTNDLPRTVRLERYRLIVAAHTILSDPERRNAYDRFGAGWDGKAEPGIRKAWHDSPSGPFGRSWHDANDPVWQNATWEDWERYYEWRRQRYGGAGTRKPPPSPLYMSNSYFVLLVATLALMGSTANSFRAHDAGTYFVEQRDIIHDRAAKELRKVKQDASQSGSRQGRIDWFLRNREATLGMSGSDVESLREEKIDRLLPDREVCNSDQVAERSLPQDNDQG